MNPTYEIMIEPARKLLRVTLSGFFEERDVESLEAAKIAALGRLGLAPNQHLTLVDVSSCKLQPQDVVRAVQSAINDPRYMAKRIAVVIGTSPARMQVRRVLLRDDAAFFDTTEAAETWLFQALETGQAAA
jgi:hypothetical protein